MAMIALGLILLTSLSCCGGDDRLEAIELVFETVARGEVSGIAQERREVIRHQSTWQAFWGFHAGSDAPPPDVDFQKAIVIVVHLGTRDSSGYAVSITRVEDRMGSLTVYFDELRPGPRCIVTAVLTQPYHIVKIPTTANEPVFIGNEETQGC